MKPHRFPSARLRYFLGIMIPIRTEHNEHIFHSSRSARSSNIARSKNTQHNQRISKH